jgi:hypothetical protein
MKNQIEPLFALLQGLSQEQNIEDSYRFLGPPCINTMLVCAG